MEQAQQFFKDKIVVVQAEVVQGTTYKISSYFQSAVTARFVTQTLALARIAGIHGLQILQAQLALALAIPTTGDILRLPIKGVEIYQE